MRHTKRPGLLPGFRHLPIQNRAGSLAGQGNRQTEGSQQNWSGENRLIKPVRARNLNAPTEGRKHAVSAHRKHPPVKPVETKNPGPSPADVPLSGRGEQERKEKKGLKVPSHLPLPIYITDTLHAHFSAAHRKGV